MEFIIFTDYTTSPEYALCGFVTASHDDLAYATSKFALNLANGSLSLQNALNGEPIIDSEYINKIKNKVINKKPNEESDFFKYLWFGFDADFKCDVGKYSVFVDGLGTVRFTQTSTPMFYVVSDYVNLVGEKAKLPKVLTSSPKFQAMLVGTYLHKVPKPYWKETKEFYSRSDCKAEILNERFYRPGSCAICEYNADFSIPIEFEVVDNFASGFTFVSYKNKQLSLKDCYNKDYKIEFKYDIINNDLITSSKIDVWDEIRIISCIKHNGEIDLGSKKPDLFDNDLYKQKIFRDDGILTLSFWYKNKKYLVRYNISSGFMIFSQYNGVYYIDGINFENVSRLADGETPLSEQDIKTYLEGVFKETFAYERYIKYQNNFDPGTPIVRMENESKFEISFTGYFSNDIKATFTCVYHKENKSCQVFNDSWIKDKDFPFKEVQELCLTQIEHL